MQDMSSTPLPEVPAPVVQDERVQGQQHYGNFGKRVFDILIVVVSLPLTLPVLAVLYVLAGRDGGPAFFGHERVGRNGVTFKCWKVRSMVTDSQNVLRTHLRNNPNAAAEWARDYKLTDDPRVTRFGRFIRKTSLDELPQIINVLKGEMSIVGPRPVVPDELKKYGSSARSYLDQKPGITGLWQVSGRNSVSYRERVAMDVEYGLTCSLALDVAIIGKTFVAVLARTGR
ncbi:MAG: sugar transferase [Pseudomonadota bacterium]